MLVLEALPVVLAQGALGAGEVALVLVLAPEQGQQRLEQDLGPETRMQDLKTEQPVLVVLVVQHSENRLLPGIQGLVV